jgi:hypothetical protein
MVAARVSRPQSRLLSSRKDEEIQTIPEEEITVQEYEVNPATCSEMHGPQRNRESRLAKVEHTLAKVREIRLQEANQQKRAVKALKGRERRQREMAASNIIGNSSPHNREISGGPSQGDLQSQSNITSHSLRDFET